MISVTSPTASKVLGTVRRSSRKKVSENLLPGYFIMNTMSAENLARFMNKNYFLNDVETQQLNVWPIKKLWSSGNSRKEEMIQGRKSKELR